MNRRVRALAAPWLLAAALLGACGDADGGAGPAGSPAAIVAVVGDAQSAVTGTPLPIQPTVQVLDADGDPIEGVDIAFTVSAGEGFVLPRAGRTDATGRATTTWYLGPRAGEPQRLTALVTANLAATFSAIPTRAAAGTTYLGRNGYIEYQPGTLPLILSAPHGGTLTPSEIRDRTSGTTVRDTNTEELVREIAAAFERSTGKRPHVVISRLHRLKLDPNREIVEAAQGSVYAEHAWHEWTTWLAAARDVVETNGGGLYLDLHGHGHEIARLELGYMLTAADLARPDATLAGAAYTSRASIRSLVQRSGRTLPELLTGSNALGTLYEDAGVPAVPSYRQRDPGSDPYFSGGYNTDRFGSRMNGRVDAVQIESHYTGVRNTAAARTAFANATVAVLQEYFRHNYGVELR